MNAMTARALLLVLTLIVGGVLAVVLAPEAQATFDGLFAGLAQ